MRYLVTGATGLIGSHLIETLSADNQKVLAVVRKKSTVLESFNKNCEQLVGDICDFQFVDSTINKFKPDIIYHLAAQSQPKLSWDNPILTHRVNVEGTHNIFRSVSKSKLDSLIVYTGSSAEYGPTQVDQKINEKHSLIPSCIYGITKVSCYYLSQLYHRLENLRVICVRPFFIIGPRKKGDVSSDLARSIISVEKGITDTVYHGNLEPIRDFLDVRDCINALKRISKSGIPGEVYNICSGIGISISEILSSMCQMSDLRIKTEVDNSKFRKVDEFIRVGDNTKINNLGWSQEFQIQDTLENILEYWRTNN